MPICDAGNIVHGAAPHIVHGAKKKYKTAQHIAAKVHRGRHLVLVDGSIGDSLLEVLSIPWTLFCSALGGDSARTCWWG